MTTSLNISQTTYYNIAYIHIYIPISSTFEIFQMNNDIPFFFTNTIKMLQACKERQRTVARHGMRREEGKCEK